MASSTCGLDLAHALARAATAPRRWVHDPERHPGRTRRWVWRHRAKQAVELVAHRLGCALGAAHAARRLDRQLARADWNWEAIAAAYALFSDQPSRDCFIGILAARLLGVEYVELIAPALYHAARLETASWQRSFQGARSGLGIFDFEIPTSSGELLRLTASPLHARNTFALAQYRYQGPMATVEAHPGDQVLDGGACWGDSALYFADRVGPDGLVFALEPDRENLPLLEQNIAANEAIACRVTVREGALWHETGKRLSIASDGPAGVVAESGTGTVPTLSIDDLAATSLPRIDFVKLDIEGAERAAIEGARQTLALRSPRLAIAAYHRPSDAWELPLLIHELQPCYELYLDHFTPYLEETILFARVPA